MLEKAENEVNIMFFPIPESLMLSLIQWWYTTKHYKDKFSSHVIFFSIKVIQTGYYSAEDKSQSHS